VSIRTATGRRLGLLLLLGLAQIFGGCGEAEPEPPNILLILVDDLGWRDTGVYGSEYYQTPNIDQLAAGGMRFTDAYSASPLCSPTRASIVTGYNPAFLRFTMAEAPGDGVSEFPTEMPAYASPDRAVIPVPSATRLALEHKTVGSYLKDEGYRTGFFGKWHLGDDKWAPERRGYDVVLPGGSAFMVERYYSPYRLSGFEDGPRGEHLDQRLAAEAVEFIRSSLEDGTDRPFFVSFWPFSVHSPFQAKKSLTAKYQRLKEPAQPQQNAVMAAMIEELDTSLGILFEGLKAAGVWRNTVVLFMSDNGGVDWMSQAPGAPMATSNYPLRGGKGQISEGGIRVPLIVSWPEQMPAGQVSDQLVSSEDLFATILHIAGIERSRPQIHDGHSLYPMLMGRSRETSRESVVVHYPHYVRMLNGGPASTIRRGRWKLIHNYATAGAGAGPGIHELFDLGRDPGEEDDLADREPDVVNTLWRELNATLERMGAMRPMTNPAFRPFPENPDHDSPRLP